MLPEKVRRLNGVDDEEELATAVIDLPVADVESLSIADISMLENDHLKDLLNDAIRTRLDGHRGGTYTSPPAVSMRDATADQADAVA